MQYLQAGRKQDDKDRIQFKAVKSRENLELKHLR